MGCSNPQKSKVILWQQINTGLSLVSNYPDFNMGEAAVAMAGVRETAVVIKTCILYLIWESNDTGLKSSSDHILKVSKIFGFLEVCDPLEGPILWNE